MKEFITAILGVSVLGGTAVAVAAGAWIMLAVAAGLLGAGLAAGLIGAKMVFNSEEETADSGLMAHRHVCAG